MFKKLIPVMLLVLAACAPCDKAKSPCEADHCPMKHGKAAHSCECCDGKK